MRRIKTVTATAVAATLMASVAACSQDERATSGGKTLTVAAYSQPTLQPNFNPFSPNALRGTLGLIYEQLFDFNTASKNEFMPSLATKYTWGDDGRSIDIALDSRARWSDGSPLTADDVVFTFEFMRQHKLLVLPLTGVRASGDGVTLTFSKPAYAGIQDIGRIAIVPRKQWASKNPDTDINRQPMGSGPYKLGRVSAQQVSFVAREDYWKQKVPVGQINYVTTSSVNLLAQQLVRHEVDLTYAGIPNVKEQYVGKDPAHNHLWPVLASMKPLMLNLKRKPFGDLHVRQGLSLALNRKQIADAYNPGIYQAVSPTGLYQGNWSDWIPAADREPVTQDQQAALAELAKAGFRKAGGRVVGPDGKQLVVRILTVGTFADAMAYSQEMASQLSQLGVKASVAGEAPSAFTSDEKKGNFDAVYGDAYTFGVNPYTFYSSMLSPDSKLNVVGWDDPATDKALADLAKAAPEQQREATQPLQKIMIGQLPVVPVVVKGTPYMYSTTRWDGWPSAQNPYTTPDPGAVSGVFAAKLMLSLRPAGA